MKVLVVGGGGREHAIVRKLAESRRISRIIALPGNGGIAFDAECADIRATDADRIVFFAQEQAIDLVIVGPDDPLALGLIDRLAQVGIRAFGPSRAAAELESSKIFAKELMKKYRIPTAGYRVFESADAAIAHVEAATSFPLVVKADGLALGKGVTVAEDRAQALAFLRRLMVDRVFGKSGDRVVIEDFLTGPEVSVLAFTDGRTIVPMVSAMDHKRIGEGDRGENTGGMGAIAPNPYYTPAVAERCMREIFQPTVDAMAREGRPFKGCLFFGLMLTTDGPKVIEYNSRFGDPETQAVLPLLESDLLEIILAVVDGRLDQVPVRFSKHFSCCVVAASGGYPGAYGLGYPILGLHRGQFSDAASTGTTVFHAGTRQEGEKLLTGGGRVLGVTGVGPDLESAIRRAYQGIARIHFEDMVYRNDIGARALAAPSPDPAPEGGAA